MKNRWIHLLIGAAMLSTVGLLATGQVDAATVLTPAQMKAQLTEQDIQEATPNKAETEKNTATNDDIGMPIEEGAGTPYARSRASYPNVNNYILQKNYQHPNVTKELHQFEMFGYKTDDGLPSGVAVHYTDNPTNFSARSEANYEINGGWQSAFVHTFIDASTILNIHNTSYGAWGSGAVGNKYFTQFEMVTARNFEDFAKTTSYSAWYTAYLLHQYNLTPSLAQAHNGVGTVWSHSNISTYLGGTDHTDPDAYFAKYGYDMNQFYAMVQHYYGQMNTNAGWLDGASASTTNIHVSGWHAATEAANKPYSYLFIMDATTNKELKRIKIGRSARADVQSKYPNVVNALNSGFSANIPVDSSLQGKTVRIISRYSSDPFGSTNYVDYAFHGAVKIPSKPKPVVTKASSMDSVKFTNSKMTVRGWYADSASVNKPNRYLVVLNAATNAELGRYRLSTVNRPDVAKKYPQIQGAAKSDFVVNVPLTKQLLGKKIKLTVRYASDVSGNGQVASQTFGSYQTKKAANKAWLDAYTIKKGNKLYAHGWHASDLSLGKPYSYIIVLNAANNRELGRYRIGRIGNRSDVQKKYPTLYNATNSGFNFNLPLKANMKGKYLKIISRYTDDISGNGNFIDYWFSNNTVKG